MDYCNGSMHFWSDDSYDCGSYPCPGPPHCTKRERKVEQVISKHEEEEARRANDKRPVSGVTIEVKLPVHLAWIGQRDQAEHNTQEYIVSNDGSNVVLRRAYQGQSGEINQITFPRHGLEAALKILEQLR